MRGDECAELDQQAADPCKFLLWFRGSPTPCRLEQEPWGGLGKEMLPGMCWFVFAFCQWPSASSLRKVCQSYRIFQASLCYLSITHITKPFSCGGGSTHISSDRDGPLFCLIMIQLGHQIDLSSALVPLFECLKFLYEKSFSFQIICAAWNCFLKKSSLSFKRSAFHKLTGI